MELRQVLRDVVIALGLRRSAGPAKHLQGLAVDRPDALVHAVRDEHVLVVRREGDVERRTLAARAGRDHYLPKIADAAWNEFELLHAVLDPVADIHQAIRRARDL